MTPCCVRLTICDLAHLRRDVAAAEAAVDDADAAFFGQRRWPSRARVTVSMLAETIGRLSVRCCEKRRREIDRGRIAALEDAVLRREEEIVERAAAHEGEQISHRLRGHRERRATETQRH